MSRFHSYINTAEKIIADYNGKLPLSVYIKSFFAKEKKYGSNDRKEISTICYQYYRTVIALKKYITEEKIIAAVFLCNNSFSALLDKVKPAWNALIHIPVAEKMTLLDSNFTLSDLFPFASELSEDIDVDKFSSSFLYQPHFFLRIRRPDTKTAIEAKLTQAALAYESINETCLQLPAGSNIETILLVDKEAVVQDYSSQKVLDFFTTLRNRLTKKPAIWDCCAASGGKSILLYDILQGKCSVTVSDIRPAILSNLHARFKKAGIKNYQYFIADITNTAAPLPATMYDIILCDAPCTGSGTWSRTPEQLYFFDVASIETYAQLQKKIVENTLPHLVQGGTFIYITCSVFAKENEAVTTYIQQKFKLTLLHQQHLLGYSYGADSMYVAVFEK